MYLYTPTTISSEYKYSSTSLAYSIFQCSRTCCTRFIEVLNSPITTKLQVYLKVSANLPLVGKVGLISNLTNSIGEQFCSLFLAETLNLWFLYVSKSNLGLGLVVVFGFKIK